MHSSGILIISDLTIICFSCQVGYDLKEEIERKFDKWQEPPPVKQVKPLPAPLDGQRKKRGGRRYHLDHWKIWRNHLHHYHVQERNNFSSDVWKQHSSFSSKVSKDEGASGPDGDQKTCQQNDICWGQSWSTKHDHNSASHTQQWTVRMNITDHRLNCIKCILVKQQCILPQPKKNLTGTAGEDLNLESSRSQSDRAKSLVAPVTHDIHAQHIHLIITKSHG